MHLSRCVMERDYDFESITPGTYKEYIELHIFYDRIVRFPITSSGMSVLEPRSLIEFITNRENGQPYNLTHQHLRKTIRIRLSWWSPRTRGRNIVLETGDEGIQ